MSAEVLIGDGGSWRGGEGERGSTCAGSEILARCWLGVELARDQEARRGGGGGEGGMAGFPLYQWHVSAEGGITKFLPESGRWGVGLVGTCLGRVRELCLLVSSVGCWEGGGRRWP